MNFGVIDWVFSGIILLFAIGGVIKGFIDNVFGKIAFIAGIILAYLFYKDIANGLLKDIKNYFVSLDFCCCIPCYKNHSDDCCKGF